MDASLADLRALCEDTTELVHAVEGLDPPKTAGGGGGCCGGGGGGKALVAVAPAPVATVEGLLAKDVELASLRSLLRKALGEGGVQ